MIGALALDASSGVYLAAGRELYASRDEGQSWHRVAGDLPFIRALALRS